MGGPGSGANVKIKLPWGRTTADALKLIKAWNKAKDAESFMSANNITTEMWGATKARISGLREKGVKLKKHMRREAYLYDWDVLKKAGEESFE